MNAIVNGRILTENGVLCGKTLRFAEKIAEICDLPQPGDDVTDAHGLYVSPGFIDVHIHGYLGADASDGDEAGLRRMAEGLLQNGVTGFLPTTMTVPRAELKAAFAAIRRLQRESAAGDFPGAQILGCHAEGPFINAKKKGAQPESAILPPDAGLFTEDRDVIRLVTLAPEMDGALETIKKLREMGLRVSIGHTEATFEQARAALMAGADHFTHVFNAMPPLHHREPGAVGAALSAGGFVELIADAFHVSPALYPVLRACAGERLVLITDCTRAGGMQDGKYTLGGQEITVSGVECHLQDGTIAGSVLKMNKAVQNYQKFSHAPMFEAVACATIHPARSLGLDKTLGALQPGYASNVLLLDENVEIHGVWRQGARKIS